MPFSWKTVKKPLVALAPMSGVSDVATRSIARQWGSDITFSEFISTDALHYKIASYLKIKNPKDAIIPPGDIITSAQDDEFWKDDKSCMLAKFFEDERPFIIQVFGNEPEHFRSAVMFLNARFRPDGFDVNFGCPAHSVINNGSGSCLFLRPELAKKIIATVKEASGDLPTSIKLRASYKHVQAIEFLTAIDHAPFESVTVHMRSYEQVHHGPANWDVGRQLKQFLAPKDISLIINGGLNSARMSQDALSYTGADGVMVAQASMGNPFLFQEITDALNGRPYQPVSTQDRISTVKRHAALMFEHKGQRGIMEMRKHLAFYFKGFPNATTWRQKLTQISQLSELDQILNELSQTELTPVYSN